MCWCRQEKRRRQERCNERTKGDNGLTYRAVIATALLGPDRPRGSDSPRVLIFAYARCPRFFARTYHRASSSMRPRYPPNEKYERFHKAPRRLQALRYYSAVLQPSISVASPGEKHRSFRSTSVFFLLVLWHIEWWCTRALCMARYSRIFTPLIRSVSEIREEEYMQYIAEAESSCKNDPT